MEIARVFKPEERRDLLEAIQEEVDRRWEHLLELCGETQRGDGKGEEA